VPCVERGTDLVQIGFDITRKIGRFVVLDEKTINRCERSSTAPKLCYHCNRFGGINSERGAVSIEVMILSVPVGGGASSITTYRVLRIKASRWCASVSGDLMSVCITFNDIELCNSKNVKDTNKKIKLNQQQKQTAKQ
jgi:hypothetical protein